MNTKNVSSSIACDANIDPPFARDERGNVQQSRKVTPTSNGLNDNKLSTFLRPHAVFALGDFLGKRAAFVKIPWEILQLKQPKTRVTIPVYYAAQTAGGRQSIDFACIEIRRETGKCISVTAFPT